MKDLETPEQLLTRAIQAETESKYLYEALHQILIISPFDKIYFIAHTACSAYQKNHPQKKK